MKLEHIAITVGNPEEIDDFYCEILGMNRVRDFTLKRDVALELFGLDEQIEVSFLEKDGIKLEIFVTSSFDQPRVDHICISVPDRELLVEAAFAKGYEVVRIKRTEFDLVFLKDRSGNLFEMRNLK